MDTFFDRENLFFNPLHWASFHEVYKYGPNNDLSTFRSILEDNVSDSLTEKIETNLRNYDKDIEKICNLYYEGFIDSIKELLQVKTKMRSLNSELLQVDETLIGISSRINSYGEKIEHLAVVENNIIRAIESLQKCLPVFEWRLKFNFYISQKRYYESLKILEALEINHLPTVLNYRFSLQMRTNIPKMKENIKMYSEGEFREFLENIRKFSPKIGDFAIRHTKNICKKNISKIVKECEKTMNPSVKNELEPSAYELIDFSPIFKTYRICCELGYKDFFEKDYRQQRKDQIKLVLSPSRSMFNDLELFKVYISSVIGFFIVEDHVRNTADEIVSKNYLEELWATSSSTFSANLNINTSLCSDLDSLLKTKTLIILAISSLKSCGYVVSQLWDILNAVRDHYNNVLLQSWVEKFRKILGKENFLPFRIESAADMEKLLDNFPFNFEMNGETTFPITLPFSSMVPKVYAEAKEFMYASMKFCEDLPLMPNEVTMIVKKAANLLFTGSFSGCISTLLRNPSLTLPQIIQVILDTKYLDNAMLYLNEFICEMTGSLKNVSQTCTNIFQFSLGAEEEVVRRICSKIDEFFELSDYDWLLLEPSGSASIYITDMIFYVRNTLQSFASALPEIAQNACKKTCKHISVNIFNLLLDNEVKLITPAALQQINLDLMQCEFFAASQPILGIKEDDIMKQFLEVRQLLDLLIMEEWSSYLHDYGKPENRYNKVDPKSLIIILEKIRESDKKNMFTSLKKSERDRKKLYDTVIKQLRNLVGN